MYFSEIIDICNSTNKSSIMSIIFLVVVFFIFLVVTIVFHEHEAALMSGVITIMAVVSLVFILPVSQVSTQINSQEITEDEVIQYMEIKRIMVDNAVDWFTLKTVEQKNVFGETKFKEIYLVAPSDLAGQYAEMQKDRYGDCSCPCSRRQRRCLTNDQSCESKQRQNSWCAERDTAPFPDKPTQQFHRRNNPSIFEP